MHSVIEETSNELVGLWEYTVETEDGTWRLIFTRGEEVDPAWALTQDVGYTRYHLHMKMALNGEQLFDTSSYEYTPFLTSFNLHPFQLCAAVNNWAEWFVASSLTHRLQQAIGDNLPPGMEISKILAVRAEDMQSGGPKFSQMMHESDLEVVQHHGDTSYRMFLAVFDYAMANTTPEWREANIGTANPEPSFWGENPNGD